MKKIIKKILDIFHWYRVVSGLAIDIEKTKLVKIGACRAKRLIWEGLYRMEWTTKFVALGIVFDVTDLENITENNVQKKIHAIHAMKTIVKT